MSQDAQSSAPDPERELTVVGVMIDPAFSACSFNVKQDETVDDIIRDFHTVLASKVNEKFQGIIDGPLDLPVETVQIFIPAVATADNTIPQSTFPSLAAQNPPGSYTVILGLHPESIMRHILDHDCDQENLTVATANLTIEDKPKKKKLSSESTQRKGRKPLAKNSQSSAHDGDDQSSIRELKQEMAAFQAQMLASNVELRSSIATLQTSNSEQKAVISKLEVSNAALKASNSEQNAVISKLEVSNAALKASNSEQNAVISKLEVSNAALKASNSEQNAVISKLEVSNASLRASTLEQNASIARLEASTFEQKASIARLDAKNIMLEASQKELKTLNAHLSSTLQRHGATLFALQRRIVIDDARTEIAKKYNFSVDELRVGVLAHSPEEAPPLVQRLDALVDRVYAVLTQTDMMLLSKDALNMIFDPMSNSIRHRGNVAAHQATLQDLADSVLGADLTAGQRVVLENIYHFAYGFKPTLHGI